MTPTMLVNCIPIALTNPMADPMASIGASTPAKPSRIRLAMLLHSRIDEADAKEAYVSIIVKVREKNRMSPFVFFSSSIPSDSDVEYESSV